MEYVLQLLEPGDSICFLTLALIFTFICFSCGGREINLRILSDEQQHWLNCRSLAVICMMQYMHAAVMSPPT